VSCGHVGREPGQSGHGAAPREEVSHRPVVTVHPGSGHRRVLIGGSSTTDYLKGSTMRPSPRLRRALLRAGLAAASTLTLAAGVLAAGTAAQAAAGGNPYAPSYQHPYRHGAVPTRETNTAMAAYRATHAPAVPPRDSANNLVFRGGVDGIGVTTGVPKVYLVFYGTQWGTSSTNAQGDLVFTGDSVGEAARLQEMFKGLGTGGELWSGIVTQYCEGVATGTQICGSSGTHVGMPTAGVLAGVWYDNAGASPASATARQLGDEAVRSASHFGNTTPALNRLAQYVVLSPHGTTPDGFNAGGGFCAWHDWNGDSYVGSPSTVGDVAFTNMPYVTDAGTSCGQNFVNAGAAGTLDGVTMVEGHEYMETVTDQNPAGGYTDSAGAENGDKCAWLTPGTQGGAANVAMGTGTFTEQGGWSNDSVGGTGQCEIAHAVVVGGGPTVANPGNQTGTVGTATSLTLAASGGTAPYTWSATGLPAGLSINATTGVVSGTPTTANSYPVTVTATDAAARPGNASFTWTINPVSVPGCSGTNPVDAPIPDLGTGNSGITITGCPGNAAPGSTVEVHIVHTYIGDLVVSLIAPSGTAYVLQNRTGGSTHNIDTVYTVNLSAEVANGTWTLRAQDMAAADSGYIDTWTLNLAPPPPPPGCTATNGTDVPIPDLGTGNSTVTITGCNRNASATSTVEVHIVHTWIGDLVVSLIAPDGTVYVLQNRTGGSTHNIDTTYTVNLSTKAANGTWTLRAQDMAAADSGYINSWTLTV
jgi:subtilisin-like proprotein convertase family protein